jgi:fatty-acyl-CoA synthase
MLGLMQDWPLTVDKILDHAAEWHKDREVVTRSVEGPIVRTTYGAIKDRAKRLSSALVRLGVRPGDRVATLAWNSGRHMEAWYAIMGIGAVCHTLNPRLFADQLCYIINHAEDRIVFTDLTFLPTLAQHRARMPKVEKFIVFSDEGGLAEANFEGALASETLIESADADCPWGGFDELAACGLCYTSGTTGNPQGVLYSHRSNFLHTLVTLQSDVMGLSVRDTVLMVVPMFHANAWGLAFSCPAVGAKMVLPGPKLDGASILELLETEQVTFSAAVPTVWQMLLQHLRATGAELSSLTETSPLGTLSTPTPEVARLGAEAQLPYKLKQGRPPLGIQLRLSPSSGGPVAHDGVSFGRLEVRGPFVAGSYFKGEGGAILDADGWFDTGDVATIDPAGYMQITDRAKDVIKSGGEWISSIDIENIAAGHPKALIAAVIGVPHPKWDERPLLLVRLRDGESATADEFVRFLEGKIARWWMPDEVVFVDDIPLGATGKIDKKIIRERFAGHVLPTARVATG